MANIVPAGSLKSGYLRLRSTVQNLKAKTEKVVANVAHTAEIGISATAAGLINGAFNDPEIAGVPLDAGIGGALITGGFLLGDDVGDHVTALGQGWLAVFAGRKARGWGVKWSAKQNETTVAQIELRRAQGQNDDGSAAGSPGDHPGADARVQEAA